MDKTITQSKKSLNQVTFFLLLLSFVLVFFTPSATAVDWEKAAKDMIEVSLGGVSEVIVNTMSGTGEYADLYKYMTGTGGAPGGELSGTFEDTFLNFILALKGIGALMCIAIAIIHLFENIERGQDPLESVFKIFIEIAIAGAFIINLDAVAAALAGIGTEISKLVPAQEFTSVETANKILKAISGETSGGFLWFIPIVLYMFVPFAISKLLSVAAKFIVIQILIEIGIRRVFMPLAVSDIYKEGLRSPGARYLKKYFATFLKMAVCLIVCAITSSASELLIGDLVESTSGVISYVFNIIAVNFTMVGVMFKAGEYTNDIVGA